MSTEQETEVKVLSILDNLKKKPNSEHEPKPEEEKVKRNIKEEECKEIRGIAKSGRFWKTKKERFNSVVKTKGIRNNVMMKRALRIELKRVKEMSRQIKEQMSETEEARKQRRRENIKRAEENKKKSEVVQVITNTKKLKRMKKKQLRFIEKRDTNKEINANK